MAAVSNAGRWQNRRSTAPDSIRVAHQSRELQSRHPLNACEAKEERKSEMGIVRGANGRTRRVEPVAALEHAVHLAREVGDLSLAREPV